MNKINTDKKIVMIAWYDARCYSGTYTESAISQHKMALFESVGFLLSTDETTTVIAAEANNQEEFRDITLIPTGCVLSVTELTTRSLV